MIIFGLVSRCSAVFYAANDIRAPKSRERYEKSARLSKGKENAIYHDSSRRLNSWEMIWWQENSELQAANCRKQKANCQCESALI